MKPQSNKPFKKFRDFLSHREHNQELKPLRHRVTLPKTHYQLRQGPQVEAKIGKLEWAFDYVELQKAGYDGDVTWPRSTIYHEFIHNPQSLYLMAFIEDKPIGFANGRMERDGVTSHLSNLVLLPEWQGFGIGTFLLEILIEILEQEGARNMELEVRESNDQAIETYEKFGFNIVKRLPSYYYQTGEDGFMMRYDFGEADGD